TGAGKDEGRRHAQRHPDARDQKPDGEEAVPARGPLRIAHQPAPQPVVEGGGEENGAQKRDEDGEQGHGAGESHRRRRAGTGPAAETRTSRLQPADRTDACGAALFPWRRGAATQRPPPAAEGGHRCFIGGTGKEAGVVRPVPSALQPYCCMSTGWFTSWFGSSMEPG